MICPKCSADTRVVDSRPHREDARIVVRKRVCCGCGHRFATQESTKNIAQARGTDQTASLLRYRQWAESATPEERAARWKRKRLRAAARAEAAETGKPVAEVMAAYGVPEPYSQRSVS